MFTLSRTFFVISTSRLKISFLSSRPRLRGLSRGSGLIFPPTMGTLMFSGMRALVVSASRFRSIFARSSVSGFDGSIRLSANVGLLPQNDVSSRHLCGLGDLKIEFPWHSILYGRIDLSDRKIYLEDVAETTESLPETPEPWLPTEDNLEVLPLMLSNMISEQLLSFLSRSWILELAPPHSDWVPPSFLLLALLASRLRSCWWIGSWRSNSSVDERRSWASSL